MSSFGVICKKVIFNKINLAQIFQKMTNRLSLSAKGVFTHSYEIVLLDVA
jgi:hypothetical protein